MFRNCCLQCWRKNADHLGMQTLVSGLVFIFKAKSWIYVPFKLHSFPWMGVIKKNMCPRLWAPGGQSLNWVLPLCDFPSWWFTKFGESLRSFQVKLKFTCQFERWKINDTSTILLTFSFRCLCKYFQKSLETPSVLLEHSWIQVLLRGPTVRVAGKIWGARKHYLP